MNAHVNWTHEETHALIAVWSEEKIQCGLGDFVRNEKVYGEVSRKLAAMGMYRSAKQCRDKVKKLKLEYRRIKKHGEGHGEFNKSFRWYDVLDSILSPAADLTQQSAAMMQKFMISDEDTNSSTAAEIPGSFSNTFISCPEPELTLCKPKNPQEPEFYSIIVDDLNAPCTSSSVTADSGQTSAKYSSSCSWSRQEVQTLLTLWANPAVQKELILNVRNNQVYARLSAALESLGFQKTPQKCREKIKKLKQDYKRMKNGQHQDGRPTSRTAVWFSIMDNVLSSKTAARRCSEPAEHSLIPEPPPVEEEEPEDVGVWFPDEVQVLLALWAQPNIQEQLIRAENRREVFEYLSSELSLVGFNKTPGECILKVNELKKEYSKFKDVEGKSSWFTILDGVLGPDGGNSSESPMVTTRTDPALHDVKDAPWPVWTSDEVQVLVSRWAERATQEQLGSAPTDERVFAQLSSDLATQGYDRTTSQCRAQIWLLQDRYREIKQRKDLETPKAGWFPTMDQVLGFGKPDADPKHTDRASVSLKESKLEHPDTLGGREGCSLSASSLLLLVPSLRLMCAFAWQVVQCCNVVNYGKVEELVRVASELMPELLTLRERVQILLRLRARMVLELCRSESTANLQSIQPHLTVIQNLTAGPSCDQMERNELENSKSNFVEVIQRLVEDKEERKMFFKDVFPVHYGEQYEHTLQTLVWKFLSQLDRLLPVPDIKQTAEWLGSSPSVMEECGRLVLDPDQLKELLDFHQKQSGITNMSLSRSPNMFLPRLSLPPKQTKRRTPEQHAFSAGYENEPEFHYGEDQDFPLTMEDGSREDEELKLINELNEGLMSENTNLNQGSPLLIQDAGRSDSDHVSHQTLLNACEYSGKGSRLLSILQGTLKTHTLPFHCNKCDKKYVSMASLQVHTRTHTGEKPFLCSHCGRGFRTSHSLRAHVSIHTGERRYKCHICGKTSIQHLARHMRMHRGEKNFLCTECGKAFLSSGELRLHTRYHTGERPHTCMHCGKGFVAKCLLTTHMRRHTGESPYRCAVCPKSFQTLKAQKKHTQIHTNGKSFPCLTCGKIFRQEDTFKIHLQTHT